MAAETRACGVNSGSRTVVVLGAGINGAALARELALSGVGVVVVDERDIACGATAWSSRLIHGGLRYLEYGEIALVRESLQERNRLVRLAPHLVRPLDFYLPLRGRSGGLRAAAARLLGFESLARAWRGAGRGAWAVRMGLAVYDLLAAGEGWPRHRVVRTGEPGAPDIDGRSFPWAAIYADAQLLYPERFTVELLVDGRAVAAGGGTRFDVCTKCAVRMDADGWLEIRGGAARRGGFRIRPDALVNATGAWVDRTLAGLFPRLADGDRSRLIGGTKGSHLVLRCPRLREALGPWGVYAEAADGRPVFVLPFGTHLVLVGTTDLPFVGDPAEARADDAEIEYLLAAVDRFFPHAAVRHRDVQQHYCGVRPLPAVDPGRTPSGITRRHMIVRHDIATLPVWSIVGGKLTTCRSLAESAAAEVLSAIGVPVRATSRERPLPGACNEAMRETLLTRCAGEAERSNLAEPQAVARYLVDVFGRRAEAVWDASSARPSGLIRGVGLPRGAVTLCVREEWATSLADIVERRLMLSFHEKLTRQTLTDIAQALVDLGVLAAARLPIEVDDCIARLATMHGRDVPSSDSR